MKHMMESVVLLVGVAVVIAGLACAQFSCG